MVRYSANSFKVRQSLCYDACENMAINIQLDIIESQYLHPYLTALMYLLMSTPLIKRQTGHLN